MKFVDLLLKLADYDTANCRSLSIGKFIWSEAGRRLSVLTIVGNRLIVFGNSVTNLGNGRHRVFGNSLQLRA